MLNYWWLNAWKGAWHKRDAPDGDDGDFRRFISAHICQRMVHLLLKTDHL